MADYKESTATGKVWQRCSSVSIDNSRGALPSVVFYEEEVVDLNGKIVGSQVGFCSKVFEPLIGTIPLLDVATLLPTGETATHAQIYQILFSLYMQTATERDAQAQ